MDQVAVRYRGYIVFCSVLSLIVGVVIGYFSSRSRKPSAPITISTPVPTSAPAPTPTPAPIRVHVSGAVQNAAVYELPQGSIVQDAIEAAGGPAPDADLASINLALELRDQQQVHVPREGEASPPSSVSGGESGGGGSSGDFVNINTATAKELEALPGVGPKTAQRIVAHREANGLFETIEDIQNVSGIGPKTFEGFEEMITVEP